MSDFCKRLIDLLASLAALLLLWPVILLIAAAVRLESRGNPFFLQERAGKNAKPFTMIKFRTMRADVDPFGNSPKTSDDPRVTRTGRFLRETSLDELPQLVNVLKGDMSLVGPRPLYVSQIAEWNDRQKRRLEAKPGITGLAQISGRGSLTIEEKLELDVQYIETRGLITDLKILLRTFAGVFSRSDIYEKKYSQNQHTRGEK
ncbi:sugar transferase [Sedimentisphaera salicampi]|uniref:Putative sugar transferase EpsL n=1 Tax=Sedimentisphaera salicampi TaxID=1941349 RepID=A0A1W6LM50_9BACT|nr:sugar transferase [Sedimentisphaera salicampi]ARN56832.1 putative sugar transferase EpsL [Sedimentisphaera salicampi]OXU15003.1 putative sugar transferase EpsL [Sedimentisphaera salicampi]